MPVRDVVLEIVNLSCWAPFSRSSRSATSFSRELTSTGLFGCVSGVVKFAGPLTLQHQKDLVSHGPTSVWIPSLEMKEGWGLQMHCQT